MRTRPLSLAAVFGAVALAVACSSSSDDSLGGDDTSAGSDAGGSDATLDSSQNVDGSAIGDGGAGDGGRDYSTDTSKFFGASRCAGAGLQLCEDFESGTIDTGTWGYVGTHPTIDGTEHARGAKALHVLIDGNGASMIKETKTFPEPGNTYWGRIFVYFHQMPHVITADGGMPYSHWTFAYGSGADRPGQIRLSGQYSKHGGSFYSLFGVGTDDGAKIPSDAGTGDWTNSDDDPSGAPAPVPTDSWQCIEWLHDGTNEVTRFFWNAVEHPSLMTTATKHGGNPVPYDMPTFDTLAIGWQEYQPTQETFEMWVDEIAVDQNRIGCVL